MSQQVVGVTEEPLGWSTCGMAATPPSWIRFRMICAPTANAAHAAFDVPGDLASAPTVALICDETEGLMFLANFSLVQEAFENPGLAADREHRQTVLGYLRDDSISTLPFRRLAGANTARASQLFQSLLKKPGFAWERDGEALLRKHKPWCFGTKPQPPVTPLSSELAEALPPAR
jgi:hypothetical protein